MLTGIHGLPNTKDDTDQLSYIIDVNDTAVTVRVMDDLGEITVPRRWIITDKKLEEGDEAEFYFSCMDVTGKRDLPAMFI